MATEQQGFFTVPHLKWLYLFKLIYDNHVWLAVITYYGLITCLSKYSCHYRKTAAKVKFCYEAFLKFRKKEITFKQWYHRISKIYVLQHHLFFTFFSQKKSLCPNIYCLPILILYSKGPSVVHAYGWSTWGECLLNHQHNVLNPCAGTRWRQRHDCPHASGDCWQSENCHVQCPGNL